MGLSLSARHLYPDLLVLEATISVDFHDEVFLGSAQLTVGLEIMMGSTGPCHFLDYLPIP